MRGHAAPPAHVGLNALFLEPGRSAGPETYLRGLVPALAREFPELALHGRDDAQGRRRTARATAGPTSARVVQLPCDEGERLRPPAGRAGHLPGARRRGAAGTCCTRWPRSAPVVTAHAARSISVHDVTFFHHRTFGARDDARAADDRRARRLAARDALVTVSAASRDDIVRHARRPPERIVVVHHGAGRPAGRRAGAERRSERARRVAGDAPRRALRRRRSARTRTRRLLVRALPHLPDGRRARPRRPPRAVRRRARGAGRASSASTDRVRIAGYVDDAELEALWRLAGVRRVPDARRGLRPAGASRRSRAACPSRARTSPCCARSAATVAALLRSRRRRRAPRGPSAAALDDAARRPGGAGVGRALQLGGGGARHVRGLRAGARADPASARKMSVASA